MNVYNKIVVLMLCMVCSNGQAFKIDRVILSTNNNPMYKDFWPVVANAWTKLTGIRPTLAYITNGDEFIDETVGDVIRLKSIPGVPDWFYAQTIRLLLPVLFPAEISLISDIDMIPLQRDYFVESVRDVPEDHFVVYRDKAWGPKYPGRFAMCYNAGRGDVFRDLFGVPQAVDISILLEDIIPTIIKRWWSYGLKWDTDEKVLYYRVLDFEKKCNRCTRLGHRTEGRIDRMKDGTPLATFEYDTELLRQHKYIDCHSIRPYKQFKDEIDKLLSLLGVVD